MHSDGSLTVYDWQRTAVGPGILDLVAFVQSSRWWFDPLPISTGEIINYYRNRLAKATDHTWDEETWKSQWDLALLWIFTARWVDLLATIPDSVLEARRAQLESLWLNPVREAASRQLPKTEA